MAGSPGPVVDCFDELKKVLKEYNFLPENIYNMNEKGLRRIVRRLFAEQGGALHK